MVEEARLESVYTPKGYRGFESPSLRKKYGISEIPEIHKRILGIFYFYPLKQQLKGQSEN